MTVSIEFDVNTVELLEICRPTKHNDHSSPFGDNTDERIAGKESISDTVSRGFVSILVDSLQLFDRLQLAGCQSCCSLTTGSVNDTLEFVSVFVREHPKTV